MVTTEDINTNLKTIEVIKATLGIVGTIDFCHGNALMYLTRATKGKEYLSDLKKVKWYIDYMVRELENLDKQPDDHVYFE